MGSSTPFAPSTKPKRPTNEFQIRRAVPQDGHQCAKLIHAGGRRFYEYSFPFPSTSLLALIRRKFVSSTSLFSHTTTTVACKSGHVVGLVAAVSTEEAAEMQESVSLADLWHSRAFSPLGLSRLLIRPALDTPAVTEYPGFTLLLSLHVATRYRRLGLGRDLLRSSDALNTPTIAFVESTNTAALAFYGRLGFVREKTFRLHGGRPEIPELALITRTP